MACDFVILLVFDKPLSIFSESCGLLKGFSNLFGTLPLALMLNDFDFYKVDDAYSLLF